LEPVKGLFDVVKWVRERGLKRAAVTNAPRINADLMISKLGLSDFFQAVIIGSECERSKPFPDPYLKALKEMNVSPDHTFIFEVLFLNTFYIHNFISHNLNFLIKE
jgi:beta-phosphoglucomutase-like phosphatase (HAD superfamily)